MRLTWFLVSKNARNRRYLTQSRCHGSELYVPLQRVYPQEDYCHNFCVYNASGGKAWRVLWLVVSMTKNTAVLLAAAGQIIDSEVRCIGSGLNTLPYLSPILTSNYSDARSPATIIAVVFSCMPLTIITSASGTLIRRSVAITISLGTVSKAFSKTKNPRPYCHEEHTQECMLDVGVTHNNMTLDRNEWRRRM